MTQASENLLQTLSNAMADAVARAAAATVLVNARRRFPASGIAYAADLVLTADHVVEREEDIQVVLPDGSEHSAALAGRDPGTDLAVLRLSQPVLAAAEQAAGDARVGQLVIALGRPSRNGIEASLGTVSALGGPARTGRGGLLDRYLRTDTIPYPGFSGGPLIDSNAKVLGINTSGLWQGGSMTIPASLAWPVAGTLAKNGRVKRGYLGIRSQPAALSSAQRQALGREQEWGLLLVGVDEDTPAGQGGLMVGDILVGLAGFPVSDPDELAAHLVGERVGQPTEVEILRGGQPVSLVVIIGERM